MANNSNEHRIQIPTFDPDSAALSAKAWINLVELGRESAGRNAQNDYNWSNSVTASTAILLLRGKSADWIANLIEEKDPAVTSWTELKKKFQDRFCVKHTLSEKTRLITDLKMTNSESCSDFFDRCKSNLNILYTEEWSEPTEENQAADNQARTKSITLHHKLLFTAGLRSDIKQDVVIQDSTTLDEVKTVAMRVEASIKDRKKNATIVEVNNIDNEVEESDPDDSGFECDAIHKQSQRQLRHYERNQNRGFRGGRGNRGNAGNGFRGGRGGQNRRFNGLCHYCHQPNHQIRFCFAKQNDERQGIFRNQRPKPEQPRENASVEASNELPTTTVSALDVSEYLNVFQA